MSELTALMKALEQLNDSASFAAKYGPFFFAVALLIVTPFVALALFKKYIGGGAQNRKAYEDFRFYFRGTVMAGLACVRSSSSPTSPGRSPACRRPSRRRNTRWSA